MIDRVHSRAIGLQFVFVSKFSLALGNLFQLRERQIMNEEERQESESAVGKNAALAEILSS